MANPAADYPVALHTSTDISALASQKLGTSSPKHTEIHGKVESELVALGTKVGISSGSNQTPTVGKVIIGTTDAGESDWEYALESLKAQFPAWPLGYALGKNSDTGAYEPISLSAGAGETNTASNAGNAGVGLYYQKSGVQLQFKNLSSPTGTISITDNVTDHNVEIEVVPGNITIASLSGTLAINKGGTGQTSKQASFDALSPLSVAGDLLAHNGTNNIALAGNTTNTRKFLRQVGSGGVATAFVWDTMQAADIPTLTAAKISDFNTTVQANKLNQLTAPDGDVDFNSKKITGLADPTASQHAATKAYVDALGQGLQLKASCRAATTANIADLSNVSTTIDTSVTLVQYDRVLVKDQSTGSENGIYVVGAVIAGFAPFTRATDADADAEVKAGLFTFVQEGTLNHDNGYVLTTDGAITVGATSLTFTQFSGAGQIDPGSGLTKTGNQINVIGTAGRIVVNADSIDIDSNYVGQSSITTLGTVGTGVWQGTAVAIGYGGTGQATAQLAINALTAVSGATNEYVLTKDTATGNATFKAVALIVGTDKQVLFNDGGATSASADMTFDKTAKSLNVTTKYMLGAADIITRYGATTNLFIGSGVPTTPGATGNNLIVGDGAGAALTTNATGNLFIGKAAAKLVTTGTANTVIGYIAGKGLGTTSLQNTLIGEESGTNAAYVMTGCIVIGYRAGYLANAANTDCIMIGNSSGPQCSTGSTASIMIGKSCMAMYEAYGIDIVAIGNNVKGFYQSVVIGNSNDSMSCQNAVTIGYSAGVHGNHTVAIGNAVTTTGGSGYINSSVVIGSGADISASAGPAIVFGRSAIATAANQCVIGSTSYPINNYYFGKGVTSAAPVAISINNSTATGTNIAAGDLSISPGAGTGTGAPANTRILRSYKLGTGSTVQTLVDALVVAHEVALTDATATSMFEVALPTLNGCGGTIDFTIHANDATDVQAVSGTVTFSAVNKAGTYSQDINLVDDSVTTACSGGTTLAPTFTILEGTNKITIQVSSDTSLTATTHRISYILKNNSPQAVTIL